MISIVAVDQRLTQSLLQARLAGKIHSVFTHTVNIVHSNSNELVCTLVCNETEYGPNLVKLDIENFNFYELSRGDIVSVKNNILHVGAMEISCANLPCIEESKIRIDFLTNEFHDVENTILKNINYVNECIYPCKHNKEYLNLAFDCEASKLLKTRTNKLKHALKEYNLLQSKEQSDSIIGLGAGLTPSGDDILLGFMAAFKLIKSDFYREFCLYISQKACSRTNIISFTALNQAVQGYFRKSIVTFVNAMTGNSHANLQNALENILKIGSSSGADIVYGIIQGFEVMLYHSRKPFLGNIH